jgi:AcrR family transcriptional regulator
MLTPKRKGADYHHGDVKRAAVLAGRNLIEVGGQPALGIRRVAEKIGVTAPAIYRHFRSLEDLLGEISQTVRNELGVVMMVRQNNVIKHRDQKKYELAKFEAIGDAYIDFADHHPLLFQVAFINHDNQKIDEFGEVSWLILTESIDRFISLGMTPKSKRESAPLIAWSAVHGLATLVANRAIEPSDLPFFRRSVMNGVQDALFGKIL